MLRAGLVGLPSSGKTTLFQLMTSAREAPRPQGRADANVGVSRVPDDRLDQLTALFNPKKRVPATVEFADMAAGRSDAKSLVDVAAYRNADALLHVVRAFHDPSVPHPQSTVDPARDLRTIEDELILADLGGVERRLERLEKDLKKTPSADLKKEQDDPRAGTRIARGGTRAADARSVGRRGAAAARLPVPVGQAAAHRDEPRRSGRRVRPMRRDSAPAIAPFLDDTSAALVGVCAKIELEIAQLDPADAQAFMADLGLRQSGLDRVIRAAYDLLGYISFFTVGEDECRAWSIPRAITGAGSRRRDSLRHSARLHSRRGRSLRSAARARIARRLP